MNLNIFLFIFKIILINGQRNFFGSNDAISNADDNQSFEDKSRKEYELLIKDSDKYGVCWINAIEQLRISCSSINEEKQNELAFLFTNCLLKKFDLPTYDCYKDKSTEKECMTDMTERAFNVYTHYFTHTQSICFFLANQLWQAKTKTFITKLSESLINIGSDVNKLNSLNDQLKVQIKDSSSAIEEFVHKVNGQSQSFLDIRDLILNELTKGYTIAFYLISLISVYFLTSTQRTTNARLPLYTIVLLNALIERIITSYILDGLDDQLYDTIMKKNKMDSLIWLSRKANVVIGVFILLFYYLRYRDYHEINYQMLNEIREQNRKIVNFFDSANALSHYLSPSFLQEYNEESDEDFQIDSSSEDEDYDATQSLEITPVVPFRKYNTRSSSKFK